MKKNTSSVTQTSTSPLHGARVSPLNSKGKALVKQTIKKAGTAPNAPYVIDVGPKGHREKHVDLANDAEVAQAIRDALNDQLP